MRRPRSAGLTTALTLHQLGIPCTVYEAARELRPSGTGVNLQPYCVRELFQLGLEYRLRETGIPARGLAYYTRLGQHVMTEKLGSEAGFDWPQFHMHRGAFHMMLADEVTRRLGPDALKLGHRCVGVEQDGDRVAARLMDRKTGQDADPVSADVLVAADGVNSTVRRQFYPDEKPPHWNRVIMWRGVTEDVKMLDGHTMVVMGSYRQKFVAYRIRKPPAERLAGENDTMLNWLCELIAPDDMEFLPEDWNRPGSADDFAEEFQNWVFPWIDVPEIVSRTIGIWEYPQIDRDPLPQWTFDADGDDGWDTSPSADPDRVERRFARGCRCAGSGARAGRRSGATAGRPQGL